MPHLTDHDLGFNAGIRAAIDYHADRAISAGVAGCVIAAGVHNAMARDLGRLLKAPARVLP